MRNDWQKKLIIFFSDCIRVIRFPNDNIDLTALTGRSVEFVCCVGLALCEF